MQGVATSLEEDVAHERIRLRGTLDSSKPPEDINPAEIARGKLDVFAQEFRILLNGRVVRIYREVECYETDVARREKELLSALKQATDAAIHDAIRAIYKAADERRGPRPNILQLADAVLPRLEKLGYTASANHIRTIGEGREFKNRRGRVGKRLS
jgi:hypothetical protein